jgi:hypothetical protein
MDDQKAKMTAVITCRAPAGVEAAVHKLARETCCSPSQLVRQLVFAGLKDRGVNPLDFDK